MHEIFQGQTGTHGALDFIYIFQGTLQPVKLTRNPQETQRLRAIMDGTTVLGKINPEV